MNKHEYMLLADGSVIPFPDGIPTAYQIADALIKYKGVAYYWPSRSLWYVILPVFEDQGAVIIAYECVPDVIKLAHMLE